MLKQFTDGILDKSYTILKRQARRENWDLPKFQEELLTEFLEMSHKESLEDKIESTRRVTSGTSNWPQKSCSKSSSRNSTRPNMTQNQNPGTSTPRGGNQNQSSNNNSSSVNEERFRIPFESWKKMPKK